jgi:methyl-accepting chemotaxis protein
MLSALKFNSVGKRIALVLVLILPITIFGLTKNMLDAINRYSSAVAVDEQTAAANNLISGVYEILMERLATNNALQGAAAADSTVLQEIKVRRTAAVQKMTAAAQALQKHNFPNKDAVFSEFQNTIRNADSYRAKADAAITKAKAERDDDTVKNLFKALTDLTLSAQKVWGAVLANTSDVDPELARLSNVRVLAWNLRDIAGYERSHVASAISAQAAIPADKLAAISEVRAQIALMWRFLQTNLRSNERSELTNGLKLAQDGYFGKFQPLAEQMRKISAEGAKYPMTLPQWVDTTTPLLYTLLEIMEGAGKASQAHTAALEADAKSIVAFNAALLVIGLIVGFGAIWFLIRSISRPLRSLTGALDSMGSESFQVNYTQRNDEIGHMARALLSFHEAALQKNRLEAESAEERARIDDERQRHAEDQARHEEEQQRVAEHQKEMADLLSETVKKNADGAERASQTANSTRVAADRGGQVVSQAVEAMAHIEQSSRKIGDIIGVIDEIARQTNLLALNAAVEAARAGEAGRGFAVVASEVRSLAQRSSQAAKDIKDLITNSNGQVQTGVELVNRAGAALTEIVESIKNVAQIVTEIASANKKSAEFRSDDNDRAAA